MFKTENNNFLNKISPIFFGLIVLAGSFLLTQCSNPVGWVAYGQHIEFTADPSLSPTTGEAFSLTAATAELTIDGANLSAGNFIYFCGPHGAEHPGTLYGTDTEVKNTWASAGFKLISGSGVVFPYSVLGLDPVNAPVLDVYAVAHMTYTIDGGKTVEPWRVSNAATIDLTPSLRLTFSSIPSATTNLRVTFNGVVYTFDSNDFSGGSVMVSGLPHSLVGNSYSVTAESYQGSLKTGYISVSPTAVLTMGVNSLSVGLGPVTYPAKIKLVPDKTFPVPYSYVYQIPASASAINGTTDSSGVLTVNISTSDLDKAGTLKVSLGGVDYTQTVNTRQILTEYLNNGYFTLNVMTANVAAPTVSLKQFTSPNQISYSFNSVAGAVKYNVYLNGVLYSQLGASDSEVSVTGLSINTPYSVKIAAVDSNNLQGSYSNIVTSKILRVVYNSNGSSKTAPSAQYILEGQSVTPPSSAAYTKNGYNSTGNWYTNTSGSGGTCKTQNVAFTPTSSMTLYVEWDRNNLVALSMAVSYTSSGVLYFNWRPCPENVKVFYLLEQGETVPFRSISSAVAESTIIPPNGKKVCIYWEDIYGNISPKSAYY